MNFLDAEAYLLSLGNEVETMKLGLENIWALLAALGEPQANYKKVQVAGTNGKGSVCAFLDSICRAANIRTGLYTSPHLISITERIKIDGVDVSEDEFARLATVVREKSEMLLADGLLTYRPTFFEQVTAIALLAFGEAKVDLAILETGLGGRYDAVTAAKAEVAAITRIDLDHQEYLGDTIEEIAAEKAAIITSETRYVVIGEQSRDAMRFLRKHCADLGIEPLNDEYAPWRILPNDDVSVNVELSLYQFEPITLGLEGRHQAENAQTAIQIAKGLLYEGIFQKFEDGEEEVRVVEGLEKARHPGRLEYVDNFLLDGAHNPSGARALGRYIDEFVDQPITLVFGAMNDKAVGEIAAELFPRASNIILTQPSNSRAMQPKEILRLVPRRFWSKKLVDVAHFDEVLDKARVFAEPNGMILVTGSLYLVGEAKKLLNNQ